MLHAADTTWGEAYRRMWDWEVDCTWLGRIAIYVFGTLFITFCMIVNTIGWTFAAIVAFVAITAVRVFVRFDYFEHVGAMCEWWLDHIQKCEVFGP